MQDTGLAWRQDVSRETLDRLEVFVDLLMRWNARINLVAKSSVDEVWNRHVRDSLQLADLAPQQISRWVDMGTGGGFPGLVIAIARADSFAPDTVHLIESDQRKSAFLREAARLTGVKVVVHAKRIEAVEDLSADVVSSRALAPLDQLCGHAARLLRDGGLALFPKGATWQAEVDTARVSWNFDLTAHPSVTSQEAAILALKGISHV